jgi:hypothetical protein
MTVQEKIEKIQRLFLSNYGEFICLIYTHFIQRSTISNKNVFLLGRVAHRTTQIYD